MLIGGVDFKKDLGKDISFSEFKKLYSGVIKGVDIGIVYKSLGGKIKPKK